jgi:SAM-dependent methyltransferase
MIKLNLGCGYDLREGYINCDKYNPSAQENWDMLSIPLQDNSVDEILAYHIIEHVPYGVAFSALQEWHRVLKQSGRLRLETPDFTASCKAFAIADARERLDLQGHFFSEAGNTPGQLHYFLLTEENLFWMLDVKGFDRIKRLDPDSSYVTGPPYRAKELMLNVEAFKK